MSPPRPLPTRTILGVWLGALAGAAAAVLTRPAPSPYPHVIVISLDTLRADMLGCYGNTRVQTPNLDALAAESVRFTHHIVAAPTTLSSHTSLLTGTYPHTHGVPRNGFEVAGENVTLAEILAEAGYRTAAMIGATPLGSRTGFTQGFQVVEEPEHGFLRHGAKVVRNALDWLAERDPSDGPVFVFVHLFDVHSPFDSPEPWRSAYVPDDPEVRALVALPGTGSNEHVRAVRGMFAEGRPEAAVHSRALQATYEAGVTATDALVGDLLRGLRRGGWLEGSVLVLTSDHGESFERPKEIWNHGYTLYDDTVRTPLLVRLPGGVRAGETVEHLVSNTDVFPSLLELVGLPVPPWIEGVSLLGVLGADEAPRTVFVEATKPWLEPGAGGWTNAPLPKAARTTRHKLIRDPGKNTWELYRIDEDPGEREDRFAEIGDLRPARILRSRIERWAESADPHRTAWIDDPSHQAALEALGYTEDDE